MKVDRPKLDSQNDPMGDEIVVWEREETISEAWIKCKESDLMAAVDVQNPHYKE